MPNLFLRKKAPSPRLNQLQAFIGRDFIVSFDLNYSKISAEEAQKQYRASIEAVVQLKDLWLVLRLTTPFKMDDRLLSRIFLVPRTVGSELEHLFSLSTGDNFAATVAVLKRKREDLRLENIRSRDIEYMGVGFLRLPSSPSVANKTDL